MLLERLIAYYGVCGDEESAFIAARIGQYTEGAQEQLFNVITQECGKRYGFPDLKQLNKAFQTVAPDLYGKKGGAIWWFKCSCGCEYWQDLTECPLCHARETDKRAVVTSGIMPDFKNGKVIRFNKTWRRSTANNLSCYDCESQHKSFCWSFGDANYDCSERMTCPCNKCCMRAR